MVTSSVRIPYLGVGILHSGDLHQGIQDHHDEIDWLEVIVDRYVFSSPDKTRELFKLKEMFPIAPHGVELSIGSAEGLDDEYLRRVSQVVNSLSPPWFSDHLCYTRTTDVALGQLTPLAFNDETIRVVRENVERVKRATSVPFLLENIAYYFLMPGSDMEEVEFVARVADESDVGLILDLANLYINSVNHNYDPYEYLERMPLHRVVEVHLAGGEMNEEEDLFVDTHSQAIHPEVWNLLDYLVPRSSVRGILIERDTNFPEFGEILDEVRRARKALTSVN